MKKYLAIASGLAQMAQSNGLFVNRPEQIKRETPKVGRNEKCPCGSNKKFKKCCMLNE